MTPRTIKLLSISAICLILFMVGCGYTVNTLNKDTDLRNQFTQKMTERTAFYDKMWKTISQKAQISKQNDSSFRSVINSIMAGRASAQGQFMNWIKEANYNSNFGESVTVLYTDLSRAVEAEREGFFSQEKVLQDVKYQEDNLRMQWPSSMVVGRRKPLEYNPITSDRTDDVMKTGKDNDVKVF